MSSIHKNNFPHQPLHNPLPRFESEVSHYVSMRGGDPDDINLAWLIDCYEKALTTEETGKLEMIRQQNALKPEESPTDPDNDDEDGDLND